MTSSHLMFLNLLTWKKDAVGSISGSEEWKKSGHDQKKEAIEHMKTASQSRDPAKDGFGKPEETAGKLFGCEGMQNEGAESKK
jgi:uncharacterized protein YjbJ (UPF0337 family)